VIGRFPFITRLRSLVGELLILEQYPQPGDLPAEAAAEILRQVHRAGIEANAPQALINGWALQFSYAYLPYFFSRAFLPGERARLGGSWLSLITVNLGGLFLWVSIFITEYQGFLHGTAYALWAVSIVPIAIDL
jgi:hypothetical protein